MPVLHHSAFPRRRRLAVLASAGIAALLSLFVAAGSAQAVHRPPAGWPHHARHTHGSPEVPGCAGLPHVPSAPVAWIDNHDEQSPLVRNLARLICSAADHATIDIKTWFILADDSTVTALANDLRVMHRAHHVRVNILVGREIYRAEHWSWSAFTRAFSFAHIVACYRECGDNAPGTVPHGKWLTVSALRQGGPAVLSMSTNWAHEQFTSAQSGIFIPGDVPLYRAFVARWKSFQSCVNGAHCTVPVDDGWQRGTHRTSVYFAPIPDDLTADVLSAVDCSSGGSITVLSMFFHRHPVETQLLRLQDEGCHIRLVLEHAPPTRISDEFPTRCEHQHDKAMVIDVPGRRMVLAGSEALTTHALMTNENQTIRSYAPGVVATYQRYLDTQWREGGTCSR